MTGKMLSFAEIQLFLVIRSSAQYQSLFLYTRPRTPTEKEGGWAIICDQVCQQVLPELSKSL